MLKPILIAFASACYLAGAAPAAAAAATPRVDLRTGALQGESLPGAQAFKGIPFAAPPVGALRWRAPQPAAPWTGLRDATRYGPDCMQKPFPSDAAPLGTTPSEDCLYANVWRPAAPGRARPVMVWIHGGGFVNGGASPPTYSGAELARQGVVVVSFNYRLGRFGSFAHPRLTRADADAGLLANYWLMDQLAALRWVRENIGAFGGDPGRVTLVGESAGGMSVHALTTSPLARGLFQGAVVQSGGNGQPRGDLAEAERAGLAFARSQGIADEDPQALAKLRALSAQQVTGDLNLSSLFAPPAGPPTFTGPVVDGRLAVDAAQAYAAGAFEHVPLMVGATSDDIGGRQGYMVTGARQLAATIAGQGVPVYYYRFSYVAPAARTPQTRGAGHASEIPFFFDTVAAKYGDRTAGPDRAAARLASGYLLNFVKRGDPNGAGLPAWKPYEPATHTMLEFGEAANARSGPDAWAR